MYDDDSTQSSTDGVNHISSKRSTQGIASDKVSTIISLVCTFVPLLLICTQASTGLSGIQTSLSDLLCSSDDWSSTASDMCTSDDNEWAYIEDECSDDGDNDSTVDFTHHPSTGKNMVHSHYADTRVILLCAERSRF